MQKVLKSYLRRLTNLSGNNRSLLLLKLSAGQFIDVHEYGFLLQSASFNIVEKLIDGKPAPLCPLADSRDSDANKMSLKTKNLQRSDHFIFEERGAKDLYVAWPFVRGKLHDGTAIRGPLCFFPVSLVHGKHQWELMPRDEGRVFLNKSLILAYSFFNELPLDEQLMEMSLEDLSTDSLSFRSQLYELLKTSGLEINFNQDNFLNELQSFKTYTRAEFEEQHQPGELKLYPEAVLGIFPQAGSYLIPDYRQLQQDGRFEDLETFFAAKNPFLGTEEGTNTLSYLRKVHEEYTFTPFPMDASQEKAIKATKAGHSLVVQGPPGTGKTQLIGNLVADFTARGLKVLVVCQKRAALDVLSQRLNALGLDAFMGLVHDFKEDRKLIFQKIAHQIEQLEEYRFLNNGLDSIQMERRFQQVSRRIEALTEFFEDFKRALFDSKESGLAIKELYLITDPKAALINLNQEYRFFLPSEMQDFSRRLQILVDYQQRFSWQGYLWRNRVDFSGLDLSDLHGISQTIVEVGNQSSAILHGLQDLGAFRPHWALVQAWVDKLPQIEEAIMLLEKPKNRAILYEMAKKVQPESPDLLWLDVMKSRVLQCFEGEGVEVSTPNADLGRLQSSLRDMQLNSTNWFRRTYWRLFSENHVFIRRSLVANQLTGSKPDLARFVKIVDNRLNLEHVISLLKEQKWMPGLPNTLNIEELEQWFLGVHNAISAWQSLAHIREVLSFLPIENQHEGDFVRNLILLTASLKEVKAHEAQWHHYLHPQQIDQIIHGKGLELKQVLQQDFDELRQFDLLKAGLNEEEQSVFAKILNLEFSNLKEFGAVEIFRNSLYLAWINHIEGKFPVLREVSTSLFEQQEEELQDLIKEKNKISLQILLIKLRERTYQSVEFNRLRNRVTYKDLGHQVNKKRKVWPIRKMLTEFSHEVFDLIPCWMASPESVSALFPMQELFDLVIFDEASQCFSERGLPSIYRGKQLVVAGDSMQLGPHDLYQVRWQDDQEEDANLEVDSLLDLSARYLLQVSLKGHYRSHHPDLIRFSNIHFYKNQLRCLPNREVANAQVPSILYHKVDGIWENQSNQTEAEEVILLLRKLQIEQPDKSFGVVTFNSAQQMLINDLLDEASLNVHSSEPTFVKNIENVQGDERDIIVFSIGYAPDKQGRFAMQFGSLNADGGENRLNVAVTRARYQVHIVSSIEPLELKVDDTKNIGPKLLKEYLTMARAIGGGQLQKENLMTLNSISFLKNILFNHINDLQLPVKASADVTFADLSLSQEGICQALILTDDNHYQLSESAKDAHAYLPMILNEKQWPNKRFYSRHQFVGKEKEADKIRLFIQSVSDII